MVALDVLQKIYTITEYLEQEDKASARHEFYNGNTQEMAGAIAPHNVIKGRFYALLDRLLDSPDILHTVLNSDTKVRIEIENSFVYPDVTVSEGTPEYYTTPEGKIRRDIMINPLLIVEVLSDETRLHDKGSKFDLYCTIPGFREYILIEPETIWIKSCYLQDVDSGLWKIQTLTDANQPLILHSLGIQLSVHDLYAALHKLPQRN